MTAAPIILPELAATPEPKPILKWAGGKRKLVEQILEHAPARIDTYFEPFVGGGAVFFALAAQKRFRRAVLCDVNAELINVYQAVRDNPRKVIGYLTCFADQHSLSHFNSLRSRKFDQCSSPEAAARTIYLNRTCYNGLYRVNKKGEFNVPFGDYSNPLICDSERILAASVALQSAELRVGDFFHSGLDGGPHRAADFIYFDPPYLPISATSNFASYSSDGFGLADHLRLAMHFHQLAGERSICCVLSNSDTPFARAAYAPFQINEIQAARAINSKTTRRGKITELLVVSRKAKALRRRKAAT